MRYPKKVILHPLIENRTRRFWGLSTALTDIAGEHLHILQAISAPIAVPRELELHWKKFEDYDLLAWKNPILYRNQWIHFSMNFFFHRIWISTSVWDLENSAMKFSVLIKRRFGNFEIVSSLTVIQTWITGFEVSCACHYTIEGWVYTAKIYSHTTSLLQLKSCKFGLSTS